MEPNHGIQISTRSFIQSLTILAALMLAAGVLTLVVPAGSFARSIQDGREVIEPQSFQLVPRPDYPAWRWLTAPVEVLWGPDSVTIITIIVFLLMVGAAFAVLEGSGLLRAMLAQLVHLAGGRRYLVLLGVSLFFMLLGGFFGIFEEIVPLVPLIIALAYVLGWDSLTGLGMSILATNLGFSAAITNPFTLGVAQRLAGLPLFSGAWLRIPIFLAVYALLALFLVWHTRRLDRDPASSPVYAVDQAVRAKYQAADLAAGTESHRLGAAGVAFGAVLALILVVLLAGPFVPILSQIALPLVGVLFLVGAVATALLTGAGRVWRTAASGIVGIAPSIPLILMAASVKQIVARGGILDTILYQASQAFGQTSPLAAAVLIYLLALVIEFFVASGSAKAFLLMPILLPLADLLDVTRQVTVTAYCFGDGFSNLAYPTNPVLLICLGLTVVSYPAWIRWTLPLWAGLLVITLTFLAIGVAVGYGPF